MIGRGEGLGSAAESRRQWLEVVLDLMPSPLLLIEPGSARVTFANRAAHRMAGGDFGAAAYRCTDGRGRTIPADELPGVRAARGERISGYQMNWHTPAGVRSLIVSADTIPPTLGQPATVVCCFEDVGALKDAEQRVREQAAEIARLYRRTREAERRKDESLALLDTLLATAPIGLAFYDLELRYVRINEALAEIQGSNPADNIGRTVEHAAPDLAPRVLHALRLVLETGEPIVDYPVSGETPAAPGEERHWLASYYPVYDGRGELLGIGAVVQETTEHVRLQQAEHAARERAEAAERRWSHIARTLQASLLPPHLPEIPGFDVAARYRPAGRGFDVGGDFYDLFERSSGRWSAVIGDVCGKGADAAALTALARHTVRATAIREPRPSRVLALLNEAILREPSDDRYCTVAYATLHDDGDAARAVVACGGHPLPLVARASGAVEAVGCPGTLLGVHPEPTIYDRTVELGPGDALVLFTDGVADSPSRDGVLAPEELEEIVAAAAGLDAEGIADRIHGPLAAISEHGTRDDAALLVLRRTP